MTTSNDRGTLHGLGVKKLKCSTCGMKFMHVLVIKKDNYTEYYLPCKHSLILRG